MNEIVWGDVLIQLGFLVILLVITAFIIYAIRTWVKRSNQMNRIKMKLENLSERKKDH
ncbi:hypothetical protein [Virgibacillus halodenitrificans]|uniref:DUF4083 domain-containing protein n=1 Tax=Virgibacillus halodenitrificans TaxID=1482 RepID=A0ABR7VN95_VIRHA|nr:hypothetical protein [Virgibacillus halodenitrificans]MBD1221992.1 hypothetical protein [Virgibacillus halodenitrificans]MCG1028459.1 hypothetical protein [Virgibacillus halodenitrificans]MCJ0930477.1 hypothetical protein [Virgibacillus halodenitrificans]CDQ32504.1 hypothetical protein BN993_01920 [Virgibacillus halodenitrificans]